MAKSDVFRDSLQWFEKQLIKIYISDCFKYNSCL